MSNDDLIKNYQREKVRIEIDINREKDTLLKYQLRKDYQSAKDCQKRLDNLNLKLNDIERKIHDLKNGSNEVVPVINPNSLVNNVETPIDDGVATYSVSVSHETSGTKDGMNIHNIQNYSVEKTVEYRDGKVVDEYTSEHKTIRTRKVKDDKINVKSRLIG